MWGSASQPGVCPKGKAARIMPLPMTMSICIPPFHTLNTHPPRHIPTTNQGSLSRVALGLSAVLAYRLLHLWTTQGPHAADPLLDDNTHPPGLLPFLLGRHAVETLGVPLGLCISRFVTAAAPSVLEALPSQQQEQKPQAASHHQYPPSFYHAALLSALELLAFAHTALNTPGGYTLHLDASFPVGALFFLFVWASDRSMRRTLDDAKLGLEASRRLSRAVAGGGGAGARAKAE